MIIRTVAQSILNKTFTRSFHIATSLCGLDNREKRLGHLPKRDNLEGESGVIPTSGPAFSLIDENLMNTVIDNVKFKDIPIVHIVCTRNNTKIILTDGLGGTKVIKTAGTEGYKNCRKGTTVAAQAVANRVVSHAKDLEIGMARLVFKGLGPGRGAAYKVMELSGIKIVSLSDRTEAIEPWIRRPRKAKRL